MYTREQKIADIHFIASRTLLWHTQVLPRMLKQTSEKQWVSLSIVWLRFYPIGSRDKCTTGLYIDAR